MTVIDERHFIFRDHEFDVQLVKPPVADVTLISFTDTPEMTMYYTTRGYKGEYSVDYSAEYTGDDAFEDIMRTKLQTPLEMVHTVWLLNDVSRAFTHQLVRYRVGTAFVQESMRFFGAKDLYKILITDEVIKDPVALDAYSKVAFDSIGFYEEMIGIGVPSQDARGILPTNILTNIFFDCSLRTLSSIVTQRLCCQAQKGEWLGIILAMRKAIRSEMGDKIANLLKAPVERGEPCGYNASFDRDCIWKNGVPEDV